MFSPPATFDEVAAAIPEPDQRKDKPGSKRSALGCRRTPCQGCPNIVMFPFEPVQPIGGFRCVEFVAHLVGNHIPKISGMLRTQGVHVTAFGETFEGVGADGLEHPKARLAISCFFLAQETV